MRGEEKHSNLIAIANTKMRRHQLASSFSYYFAFIGLGMAATAMGPTFKELVDLTHSDIDKLSFIFTARGFGYLLGSMTGRLYDRFDGHKLLSIAVMFSAVFLMAVPLVKSMWGQGIVWFGLGFFTGSLDTGGNTLIVWVWKEKVSPFMQSLHLAFGIGAFMSPLILASMHEKSLVFQYWALGIPLALSAFPPLFFKSPKGSTSSEVQEVELDASTTIQPSVDTVPLTPQLTGTSESLIGSPSFTSNLPLRNIEEPHDSIKILDKPEKTNSTARRLRIEVVLFAAILLLLDVGAEMGYGGWIATYAREKFDFTSQKGDFITAVFWGTFTIGRAVAVVTSLHFTPRAMLFMDVAGCSFVLVLLIIFRESAVALWLCTVGFGFFVASVFPTVISLPQTLGVEITGTDTSWIVVGASCGEMLVPMLIGILQKYYALIVLIWMVLISEILGGITFATLLIRVKYLTGELSGSFTSVVKGKISVASEKFIKLDEEM